MHPVPSYDEKNLLLQIADGDEKAFTILLRSYWNKVYSQALTYLKSSERAQEIAQDIFVKIWSSREKLSGVDSFSNYLFIVSRNEIISSLRKKETIFTDPTDDLTEAFFVPDQQLQYKETNQRLLKAIEQLPPTRRIVFKMSRFEGKSYQEIGEELNISRNGVKDHIVKALNFLRTNLRFVEMIILLIAYLFF